MAERTIRRRIPKRLRRTRYALQLARAPFTWGSAAAALVAAITVHGPIGISLLSLIAAATWVSAAQPRVQRRLDCARKHDAFRRNREARETQLEEADVPRHEIAELTDLVYSIVAQMPDAPQVTQLEILLDRYALLAITASRLRQSIAATVLEPEDSDPHSLRGAVVRRRTAQMEDCRSRCEAIDRELEAIAACIRTQAAISTGRSHGD